MLDTARIQYLVPVTMREYLEKHKYPTAFLKLEDGYHEILSMYFRFNQTISLELEDYEPNHRVLIDRDVVVYIWDEQGQMMEDKYDDETLCDYAYDCYQDWLQAWQQNPTAEFAEHVIIWRNRFLQFAVGE